MKPKIFSFKRLLPVLGMIAAVLAVCIGISIAMLLSQKNAAPDWENLPSLSPVNIAAIENAFGELKPGWTAKGEVIRVEEIPDDQSETSDGILCNVEYKGRETLVLSGENARGRRLEVTVKCDGDNWKIKKVRATERVKHFYPINEAMRREGIPAVFYGSELTDREGLSECGAYCISIIYWRDRLGHTDFCVMSQGEEGNWYNLYLLEPDYYEKVENSEPYEILDHLQIHRENMEIREEPSNSDLNQQVKPEPTVPATTAPKPTVPATTAPKPTVPATTAPKPAVPATTAPKPTVPTTTAPKPTVPATTAPKPTVPATTAPKPTDPATTVPEPTAPATTVPETTVPPVASHSGDIVLLPETLDYMNRIADSFVMHAAGGDPPIPYKKGMSYYPFYEVIAAFTGENSVLQGQKDGNDMIVSKDDVKAFMVNILAWEPPADNPDLDPGCFYDEDSYVVYDYNGDEEKPIVIHNIRMDGPDRIRMTVPKHATSYDFVFERNWGSTYEWILVEVVDNNEEIFESEVMTQALYEHGIVVPGDGSPALTSLSSGQELSMEGAEAQMRQYLKYVGGGIAETVVAEDWGLIANSYYTYKVTVTDTNQIYLIGTSDAALAEYHGDDVPRTWFDWNLME